MNDRKIYRGIMRSVERPSFINLLRELSEWWARNFSKQAKGGESDASTEKE